MTEGALPASQIVVLEVQLRLEMDQLSHLEMEQL
jgi:hypothetical protein